MKAAIQCVLLLAVCISAVASIRCLCIRTNKSVNPSLIADIQHYQARPYCSHEEIIVTLNDGTERCLDPTQRFIQAVLQKWKTYKSRAKGNDAMAKSE